MEYILYLHKFIFLYASFYASISSQIHLCIFISTVKDDDTPGKHCISLLRSLWPF